MRNEYNNQKPKVYVDAIGLNTLILFSTELFPRNEDIKSYASEYFNNIELREYLFKSRTLLVARLNRHIYNMEVDEIKQLYKGIRNYIDKDEEKKDKNTKNLKQNKSKDNLKTWLENI